MLAGRRGLSPSLIGRASALARLQAIASEPPLPSASGPRLALVSGDAGVGKTRLLRELLARVPPGALTLSAAAEPEGLGRPGQLAAALWGDGAGSGDDGLGPVLSRIGSGRALIVAEDLHWADAESVLLLEGLAAQPRPLLTIVGSYRPDELTRGLPAEEMLRRLVRRHDVHQERLEPLTRQEVSAFLAVVYGRSLPSGVTDALYSRTGGNPFFLEELLTCCDGPAEDLATQPLPWTLEEVVSRQLEGLEAEERRVVDAAAVLGRRAGFDALAAVTGLDEAELIERLRRLVGRALLVEDDHDQFSFRHALVRDAVESQLLGRQRRRLHEAALLALREVPDADYASLARHAAGADRHDELLSLAREGAAHYLERGSSFQALRLATDGLARDPDALDLRSIATQAAWRVGLADESIGHVRRWLDAVAAAPGRARAPQARPTTGDDPADERERACRRGEALRWAVRLFHELDQTDELWRAMDELADLVDRLPSGVGRAQALASLAQVHMLRHNIAKATGYAAQATAEATTVGGRAAEVVAVQAAVEGGSALLMLADGYDEGRAMLEGAIDRAEALGEDVLVGRAVNNLLGNAVFSVDDHRRLVERMHRAVERGGLDGMRFKYHHELADIAIRLGDQATAALELDRALQQEHLQPTERAFDLVRRAVLELEVGGLTEARRLLEQATDLMPDSRYAIAGCDEGDWHHHTHARLLLAAMTDDATTASALWEELALRPAEPYRALVLEDTLLTIDAASHLGLPAAEIRAVVVEPLLPWWGRFEDQVRLVEGLLAAQTGDHTTAVARIERGLAADPHGLPRHLAGSLRLAAARAHLALGRPEAVPPLAEAACADLARWPGWRQDEAFALARRVRHAVAPGAGRSPTGPAPHLAASEETVERAPFDELTNREREVVTLVAEGLSNAELARKLFISPKTASVHVSNVLAKLGMSRRAEIAAWAARHGLAPGG
jgi:DNA-binding CsgD family transcriptional regulator/tetratricopeptide (TPR) repeat protein